MSWGIYVWLDLERRNVCDYVSVQIDIVSIWTSSQRKGLAFEFAGVFRSIISAHLLVESEHVRQSYDRFHQIDRDLPLEVNLTDIPISLAGEAEFHFNDRADFDILCIERCLSVRIGIFLVINELFGHLCSLHLSVLEIIGHDINA